MEVNVAIPLFTDLCLSIRSDSLGVVRGLGELVTSVYESAVTYAFPDPLITAYRPSVIHVSLIDQLSSWDGTRLDKEGTRGDS